MDFGDLFRILAEWWVSDYLSFKFYFFGVELSIGAIVVWCLIGSILIGIYWRLRS